MLSKSERTRQFIIERAGPVFNTNGYAGTSMSDLTKETGLTKGSIYGNFENKDEIALACFDYNFGRVNAFMKSKILAKINSIDRLLAYPQVYRDFLTIPFLKTGCPILNTSTESDDTHALLKDRAAKALLYWKQSIENQVKRGLERKEIKVGTNPVELAVVLISLIEGAVMQAKLTGRSQELKITMGFLSQMIEGIRR